MILPPRSPNTGVVVDMNIFSIRTPGKGFVPFGIVLSRQQLSPKSWHVNRKVSHSQPHPESLHIISLFKPYVIVVFDLLSFHWFLPYWPTELDFPEKWRNSLWGELLYTSTATATVMKGHFKGRLHQQQLQQLFLLCSSSFTPQNSVTPQER